MLLRTILVISAAYYGASALFAEPKVAPPAKAEVVTVATTGEWIADAAWSAAASAAGIKVSPLTPGNPWCSPSILANDQIEDLLAALPPEHRRLLAKVLDNSSTAWSAQLYTGPQGMGLFLPFKARLIVFESLATSGS